MKRGGGVNKKKRREIQDQDIRRQDQTKTVCRGTGSSRSKISDRLLRINCRVVPLRCSFFLARIPFDKEPDFVHSFWIMLPI